MIAFVLLQVPPVTSLLSVWSAPAHIDDAPVIVPALGNGLTVTIRVAIALQQLLVTV